MHFSVDVNFQFSIFGLFLAGIWIYGIYRGYMRGIITMTVSLSVLFVGLIISAMAGLFTSLYFYNTGSQVPHVFGSLILALLFFGVIWASNFVQKIVFFRIRESDPTEKVSQLLGAFAGFLKFFVITGVYCIVLLNFDSAGNFLPDRDKNSYLINGNAWVLKKMIKPLNYPNPQTGPIKPKNYTKPNTTVIKKKNNTTNNTNTTPVNKPKNNLVIDVPNP